MNELQLFNYEGQELRTVLLNDMTWWVANDVAKILSLKNIRKNLAAFPDDEQADVTIGYTSSNGIVQNRKVLCVNEAGLYRLIFQSRKAEAEKFKRWVFHEVIPAIRKTGSYTMQKNEPLEEELSAAVEMQKAQMLIRAAEHKAIPKGEQLRLLNTAIKILTGKELDFSAMQEEPQKVVSLMKLPEVICQIKNGTIRNFGEITIKFYSLLEIADILGIAPVKFDRFADNYKLKNDGHYGMWERIAVPQGEAREFVYRQSAIQKYKNEVNHKC